MCRLFGFMANEPTKVACTLVHAQNALLHQSRRDMLGRAHPHGWGIGFYEDGLPYLERRASPAFDDLHFSATAERVFSRTIIAHVRQATVGKPSVVNTHPFANGNWIMAHNGTVTDFDRVGRTLEAEIEPRLLSYRQGSTDSELLFLWLISRLHQAGIHLESVEIPVSEVAIIVREAISFVAELCGESSTEEPAKLNILLTNGTFMLATRWNNSLYWLEHRGVHACPICGVPHIEHSNDNEYRAVAFASEPISPEMWSEVPNHSLIYLDRMLNVVMEPFVGVCV